MNRSLLDKFYKGECSPEEVQTVLQWFQSNHPDAMQEEELHALWREAGQVIAEEEHAHDASKAFSRIKVHLQEREQEQTRTLFLQLQQPQLWFKAAAAVLLPLCLIWALVLFNSGTESTKAVYMSVVAAPGVKKTIRLPDGSVIKLNSGSSVAFRKGFAGGTREIMLQGEAFFEVAKDSLRPFIVHTGNISTQALGTSFNISYLTYNDAITVALATGVVKIDEQEQGRKQQLARLVPGQQLSYRKVSQQYTVAAFSRSEVLGWKEGVLHFKQANLNQVVKKLENWYGVDIEVDNQGMKDEPWSYTGEYNNEMLEKVLEGIGFVKGFTYERTGNKIRIHLN